MPGPVHTRQPGCHTAEGVERAAEFLGANLQIRWVVLSFVSPSNSRPIQLPATLPHYRGEAVAGDAAAATMAAVLGDEPAEHLGD
jgi:hypothetical protein